MRCEFFFQSSKVSSKFFRSLYFFFSPVLIANQVAIVDHDLFSVCDSWARDTFYVFLGNYLPLTFCGWIHTYGPFMCSFVGNIKGAIATIYLRVVYVYPAEEKDGRIGEESEYGGRRSREFMYSRIAHALQRESEKIPSELITFRSI